MVSAVYSVVVTHKPVPGRCREHSTAQRPVLQCSSGSTVVVACLQFSAHSDVGIPAVSFLVVCQKQRRKKWVVCPDFDI